MHSSKVVSQNCLSIASSFISSVQGICVHIPLIFFSTTHTLREYYTSQFWAGYVVVVILHKWVISYILFFFSSDWCYFFLSILIWASISSIILFSICSSMSCHQGEEVAQCLDLSRLFLMGDWYHRRRELLSPLSYLKVLEFWCPNLSF